MKLEPIIISLLDTDLYKFNMHQVMFHKHTDLIGEYHFKCRNTKIVFTKEMFDEINEQIDHLCSLKFTKEELSYLRNIRYIKDDYVEFLRIWRPLRDYVETSLSDEGELSITIKGPMFGATHFEIYLLEIVNEVYFRFQYEYEELLVSARSRLEEKVKKINDGVYTFKFAEFGCRRRLSRDWQEEVISTLIKTGKCVGTSNVYLAKKLNIKPIGTYAHEFVQMYQGISKIPLAYTNYYAMKDWFNEYNGDNGTALTDTLTTDLFLLDFDFLQASTYTGLRHDSGDPFVWGDKILKHYDKLGIDPKNKTLLFSDSLDFDYAEKIYQYFKDRCKVSFGIGTYCSNDTHVEPLNIVIKLQYVNNRPVAKLSDVKGKTMCKDTVYLKHLEESVNYRVRVEKE